jgi:SAM-dependent methyltransferase
MIYGADDVARRCILTMLTRWLMMSAARGVKADTRASINSCRDFVMTVPPAALYGFLGLCVASAVAAVARARLPEKRREPVEGQGGKDVVWVPTPSVYLEKMLDLARLTSRDYLIDLGSGDGRVVIAAAKRGARALGVEYNPDLVELSRRTAAVEGVADRATFMQGDLYEADISGARHAEQTQREVPRAAAGHAHRDASLRD